MKFKKALTICVINLVICITFLCASLGYASHLRIPIEEDYSERINERIEELVNIAWEGLVDDIIESSEVFETKDIAIDLADEKGFSMFTGVIDEIEEAVIEVASNILYYAKYGFVIIIKIKNGLAMRKQVPNCLSDHT